MAIEEFSFPISDSNHSPIDSPPLWQLSPPASPTPCYGKTAKGYYQDFPRKVIENGNLSPRNSCSYNLEGRCMLKRSEMKDNDDEDEQEEKMDMLWEDLNEESYKKHHVAKLVEFHNYSRRSTNEMVEFGCVPTSFKLVKACNNSHSMKSGANNNLVKSGKKPSMVVLMKVLKKFFALQRSQHSAKKRSR